MAKGKSYTREYNIWRLMKRRCNNKNDPHYDFYGGRGIKVCDEWQKSDAFLEWAYANGYADNLELDRIDPDGNYEPSNCQWITKAENIKRRRKTCSSDQYWEKRRRKLALYCESHGFPLP